MPTATKVKMVSKRIGTPVRRSRASIASSAEAARERLVSDVNRAYTAEVCADTLRVNAEFAKIARQ